MVTLNTIFVSVWGSLKFFVFLFFSHSHPKTGFSPNSNLSSKYFFHFTPSKKYPILLQSEAQGGSDHLLKETSHMHKCQTDIHIHLLTCRSWVSVYKWEATAAVIFKLWGMFFHQALLSDPPWSSMWSFLWVLWSPSPNR